MTYISVNGAVPQGETGAALYGREREQLMIASGAST
jgi:hypothetical protein